MPVAASLGLAKFLSTKSNRTTQFPPAPGLRLNRCSFTILDGAAAPETSEKEARILLAEPVLSNVAIIPSATFERANPIHAAVVLGK